MSKKYLKLNWKDYRACAITLIQIKQIHSENEWISVFENICHHTEINSHEHVVSTYITHALDAGIYKYMTVAYVSDTSRAVTYL